MAKKIKPPTQAQLNVIGDFDYSGPEPKTVNEASLIIKKCLDGQFKRKVRSTSPSSTEVRLRESEDNMQQHSIPPELANAAAQYAKEYAAHTSVPKVVESNLQLLWKFWSNLPVEKRYTDDGYYIYGAFFDICRDFPSFIKEFTKYLTECHSYVTNNKAAVLSPQSQQFRQFLCSRFTNTGFPKQMVYYLDEWLSKGMRSAVPKEQQKIANNPSPTYPNLRKYWESDPWLRHRFEFFYDFLDDYEDFAAVERLDERDRNNTSHPVFEKFLREVTEKDM